VSRRLVLASDNPGKLRELRELLGDGWELLPQQQLGVSPAVEDGSTFRANALLKARHAAASTGLPALADDSGLEVDALGGAPGVHSARYAGIGASDDANNRQLLRALAGVPPGQRGARYRCVLALVRSAADTAPLLAEGRWEGQIAELPAGSHGFGYDPLFIDAVTGRRASEMSPAEKNVRSHRGAALRELVARLRQWPA
jgi:XTP/dITP diphosphohydrolase